MATFRATVDGAEIVVKTNSLNGKETVLYEGTVVSRKTSYLYMTVHAFNVESQGKVDVFEVNVIGGLMGHGYVIRKNGIVMAHKP